MLRDLANISAEEEIKRDLEKLVYPINIEEEDNISISAISVISFIKKNVHDIDLVVVGETDVLVSFVNEEINKDKYRIVRVILVCFCYL